MSINKSNHLFMVVSMCSALAQVNMDNSGICFSWLFYVFQHQHRSMYIYIPVPDEEPSLFLIGHQDFIHDLSRPVIYPK